MARTTAADVTFPGFRDYRFTYAEMATSMSGLDIDTVRALYRSVVAMIKDGRATQYANESYLPVIVQVGLGLAMAQDVADEQDHAAEAAAEMWAEGAWLRAAENDGHGYVEGCPCC